jgi:hypothetical protein
MTVLLQSDGIHVLSILIESGFFPVSLPLPSRSVLVRIFPLLLQPRGLVHLNGACRHSVAIAADGTFCRGVVGRLLCSCLLEETLKLALIPGMKELVPCSSREREEVLRVALRASLAQHVLRKVREAVGLVR